MQWRSLRGVAALSRPEFACVLPATELQGALFDPDIVDAFVAVEHEFQTIAGRYADVDSDPDTKMDSMATAIAEDL